jgi:peptidoglycan/LPS O-acetylase OafA/YrhL
VTRRVVLDLANILISRQVSSKLAALRESFGAPLYSISKKRIIEIDILRATAILLIVLVLAPQRVVFNASAPISNTVLFLIPLTKIVGLSIFFFVSGFSLYLNNKTIRNSKDVLSFYKKRVLRIYPLYWVFVAGLWIVEKPSFTQMLIYITGLEALFYPILISSAIFHFLSALIIFYLLFPFIVRFDNYTKMLVVSVAPSLFFAFLLQLNVSDVMFLSFFSVFVGGIIAAKADLHNKMRQMKFNEWRLLLTVPLLVASLSLLIWVDNHVYSATLAIFLNSLCEIPAVLVILYWAVVYVQVFNTKFRTFFTFVAFSTFGVYFLFEPFFRILANTLYVRYNIIGAAAATILVASIPLIVMAGYLLQLLTNVLVNSGLLHLRRFLAGRQGVV